ncbi:unnamed protein product [Penicillium salamii]|uniref:Uncharacterized protein n=1 Tax=Penicillium salamii TaxID=1612424 RepID=A0A9W4J6T7_9EURO|nr:unnamed protein product [Penicillium salamii]CAG8081980.1 unnamed protein product [Penicillium salamii]CAG8085452.1 unnamed protein product [Penicillium salamii]CAG8241848.1 unnamed protein product [Penicillium salamii]CAG8245066.1 unnamed protein product [Penicillium salamii]
MVYFSRIPETKFIIILPHILPQEYFTSGTFHPINNLPYQHSVSSVFHLIFFLFLHLVNTLLPLTFYRALSLINILSHQDSTSPPLLTKTSSHQHFVLSRVILILFLFLLLLLLPNHTNTNPGTWDTGKMSSGPPPPPPPPPRRPVQPQPASKFGARPEKPKPHASQGLTTPIESAIDPKEPYSYSPRAGVYGKAGGKEPPARYRPAGHISSSAQEPDEADDDDLASLFSGPLSPSWDIPIRNIMGQMEQTSGRPRSSSPRRAPGLERYRSSTPRVPSGYQPPARSAGQTSTEAQNAARIARMPHRVPAAKTPGVVFTKDNAWFDKSKHEILAHVHVGPDKTSIGLLRLSGLSSDTKRDLMQSGKQSGSNELPLWFKDLCTPEQFEQLRDYSAHKTKIVGWFEGFAENNGKLFSVAERLRRGNKIAIHYFASQSKGPQYSMVAWSRESSAFRFPDWFPKHPPRDAEIPLLFAVQTDLRPICELGPSISSGSHQPSLPPLVRPPPAKTDLEKFMAERNIVVGELATIEHGAKRLKADCFYLHIPSEDDDARKDFDLLKKYLVLHEMTVFTGSDNDGWSKFFGENKKGVVIFHESFAKYAALQPRLIQALQYPSLNFWVVRVEERLWDMPSQFFSPGDHCTRIFPGDGVILLTEDMLGDLKRTAILLQWIREQQGPKASPDVRHIMLHPGVMEWIRKRLGDERLAKDHAVLKLVRGLIWKLNPSKPPDDMFKESSLDPNSTNAVMSPHHVRGYDSPNNDEPKSKEMVLQDANSLIRFFADWGQHNVQRFKHFVVVTSITDNDLYERWKAYGHITVIRGGHKSLFGRFKIRNSDLERLWNRVCNGS